MVDFLDGLDDLLLLGKRLDVVFFARDVQDGVIFFAPPKVVADGAIPDSLKAFVDSKVGPGRLKDASAYMQLLIEEAMEAQEGDFSDEQRERIDQMLLDSADSFDRGEYAPLRPGEFEELAIRMVEHHQGKQASRVLQSCGRRNQFATWRVLYG